jgi:hypothetical protein
VLSGDNQSIYYTKLHNFDLIKPAELELNTIVDFYPSRYSYLKYINYLSNINSKLLDRLLVQNLRAEVIYEYGSNRLTYIRDHNNYIEIPNNVNKCGHDLGYKCYSDSDKCIICDTLNYRNLING